MRTPGDVEASRPGSSREWGRSGSPQAQHQAWYARLLETQAPGTEERWIISGEDFRALLEGANALPLDRDEDRASVRKLAYFDLAEFLRYQPFGIPERREGTLLIEEFYDAVAAATSPSGKAITPKALAALVELAQKLSTDGAAAESGDMWAAYDLVASELEDAADRFDAEE
jgi:hypothetical protein